MNHKNNAGFVTGKLALAAAVSLVIAGCGGGGSSSSPSGGDTSTQSGQFKDSNVQGLTYTIDGESRTTAADGSFEYVSGDAITFSLGNVELGTVSGDEIITLVQLIDDGATDQNAVINRARLLQYLDANQDTADGIRIPAALRDAAADWAISDFSDSAAFEADVAAIEDDVEAEITGATLPTAGQARDHIEQTQRCVRAGAYRGSYRGSDAGPFGLLVSARTGDATGVAMSEISEDFFSLDATQSVALDTEGAFVSGSASSGASFRGAFDSVNALSGSWENPSTADSGSFSGRRVGGDADAKFRFTGSFSGGDGGLFAFDVNGSNDVTGVAYSVSEDELYDISGSVAGSTLTASFSGNAGSINGTLDLDSGSLSGSWDNSDEGVSGTFSGDGCALN
ncbi:hypothetical protein [Marinobacter sp.]|uniref:hypothetical protein n=1 Tax=Marinobacter sp. TaxID=50741 RepID=UPI0034A29F56